MFRSNPFWKFQICFAPEGGAGAGNDTVASGGNDTIAGGGTDTVAGGGDGGTAKWWEGDKFSDDQRASLTALGLTMDDPLEAMPKLLDMEANAKRRLGASPDTLMAKPKEGQDVSEWLRENGEIFGIPKEAADYEVAKPEDWPKDAKWDETMETEARKIAIEEGLSGKALNRFVGLYASTVQTIEANAADQLTGSTQEMMAALQNDWGDKTAAKVTQAQQAMSVLAEKAGFDQAAVQSVAAVLTEKSGGDANVIRLFSALGDMMGEDSLVGLNSGAGALGTTPAEARQKLSALRGPEGEYGKAFASNNRAKLNELQPEIERLTKLASG